MCEWLAEQTVPAKSITYKCVKPQGCYTEWYVVEFESPIEDIRDYRMKRTMEFRAYGRRHLKKLGMCGAGPAWAHLKDIEKSVLPGSDPRHTAYLFRRPGESTT